MTAPISSSAKIGRRAPDEEEESSTTSTTSTSGSATLPANAADAANDTAVASAIFFILVLHSLLVAFGKGKPNDLPFKVAQFLKFYNSLIFGSWRYNFKCFQISKTCVPTLLRLNSSSMCSLNKPMHPLDERLPILRVS